ncbi:hypothetical protein KIN_39620 [Litoreibacter roseus]|uniref:Uncharacterized protein n=2 Tax=Litoreibacter roseus TaxID=2601869 RepID=A0A6N6JNB3_9RHOB|nr:hypothetical protein KIN_39620 [Litoreibacter roseus]
MGPLPAIAHDYQTCMSFHLADCQMSGGGDPLGICQAQADAFCSNHGHGGGGGFDPFDEPVLAIEDRDDQFIVTYTFSVESLPDDSRRLLMQTIKQKSQGIARDVALRNMRFRHFSSRTDP